MINLIIIAPPAAGKGTQCKLLKDKYNYEHLSTGNILRQIAGEKTEIGKKIADLIDKGIFVSDATIIDLIQEKRKETKHPLIFDGIPRTLTQAQALDKTSLLRDNDYVVINIELDNDQGRNRILGRRICPSCEETYNTQELTDDKCLKCQSSLKTREDDTLDIYEIRYKYYQEKTIPVLEFYREKGKLYTIDGTKSTEEIFQTIEKIIKEVNHD